MRISPLFAVSGILVVVMAGLIVYAPSFDGRKTSVSLQIPASTYEMLIAWGKAHPGPEGRPRSARQAVEALVEQ